VPEYLLPDVGEGLTEADIVTWRVAVGDEVAINDVVVEIETAKSIVELPSPYAGIVTALLAAEGDTVQVGMPIIRIGEDAAPIDLSNPAASGGTAGESLVGRITEPRGPARRPRRGAASPPTEAAAAVQMQVSGAFAPGEPWVGDVVEQDSPAVPAVDATAENGDSAGAAGRPLAKPTTRALARELGVDLASVPGSGPEGVVTMMDVARAGGLAGGGASDSPSGEHREPIKGVRKMMAAAMTQSAFTVPHVTEWLQVDATATIRFVAELKRHPDYAGVKMTPLALVARAVVLALGRTPELNAVWDDHAQEVVFRDQVNLGIAAATPRGLLVPNLKDAHRLDLAATARALESLTTTALAGKTQPEEYANGTFTITNVGVFGVDGGTPIINPGESAILCLGAIRKQPWVVTDAVTGADGLAIRHVMTLAISFDHRHIDGAMASGFLTDVAALVEDPARIQP
jgi:2-oxoisovalerate dehydrogenase E2 component (dihydrolipoyl transacylase)